MIRVIVGWLGERVGWHLAFTASRLAAVSSIVRYCPVPLSPFSFCTIQNLWFCRWPISESCLAKLDFPSCMYSKIFVEKEINRTRKFDLSVSLFLEWVKKSHPPVPPATILK
jgi:hypothetical protein